MSSTYTAPIVHADIKALAVERLPDAELFIRSGESHLGGFGAAEEVLETLLKTWDRKPMKEAL